MARELMPGGAVPAEVIPPGTLTPAEVEVALGELYLGTRQARRDSWFDGGEILIAAKEKIEHGRWLPWLERLGISATAAARQMRIASDPNLLRYRSGNCARVHNLPAGQGALYALCGLPEETFGALVETGALHPEMTRAEAKIAIAEQGHPDSPAPLSVLEPGRYRAILADPPWAFETWGAGGKERSPDAHYPTMTLEEIKALPVEGLAADDCLLFLWIVSHHFGEAGDLMKAWGFDLVTVAFNWVKEGPPGMGYWTRKGSELCLLGKRGAPQRLDKGVQEVIRAPRGRHSQKPAETYSRIEKLTSGPYLELFSRRFRHGWDSWGKFEGGADAEPEG